ncbi:MAG TPA: ATP-binding protein, partial [Trebonia sp.]
GEEFLRYTGDVHVAGRRKEMEEIGRLLDRARRGAGGMLVLYGPAGSGKTLLAAAADARGRGFEVLWARLAGGQPGRMAWAQLLRDTDASADLAARLLAEDTGPHIAVIIWQGLRQGSVSPPARCCG